MGAFDKFLGKIGLMDPEDELDERPEDIIHDFDKEKEPQQAELQEAPTMDKSMDNNNVVDFHAVQSTREKENVASIKMKVIVIEPKTFDDAQQVANNLREKKPVVINFEKTDAADAKRIIDFISGTTYALNGEIKKVGHNVFLCAPSNVNVSYTEEERKVSSEMPWLNHDK